MFQYLNIFLTRADGLRRRLSSSTAVKDGMDYATLRDIFQVTVGLLYIVLPISIFLVVYVKSPINMSDKTIDNSKFTENRQAIGLV